MSAAASPADVAAALARLREAGRALRARPAARTLDVLADLVDALADPEGAPQRELAAALAEPSGFAPATLREGLRAGLGAWSGAELRALVRAEIGGPEALEASRGFAVTAVWMAGAIPMPSILDVLAPLLLRSPVAAKPSAHDPVTAPWLARRLAAADPLLGACVAVLPFGAGQTASAAALARAGCVAVTGSDEAVAAVSAHAADAGGARVVAHGHKLSVAVLGPAAGPADVEGLARDVALWDQAGCLSPVAVYALGGPDPGEALHRALARAGARWPRGRVPVEAAAAVARERDAAAMRGARVWEGDAHVVVSEPAGDGGPRPAPLHRFVRVHRLAGDSALEGALRPLAPHLQAVALAGVAGGRTAWERRLGRLGASRVCAPGQLQAPPLGWRRDGCGVLTPFVRDAGSRS